MKKLLLFVSIIIIPILLLTGCGKEKEEKVELKSIELFDKDYGFKTTFKYDPSLTISDLDIDDENKSREISFDIKELDIDVEMYYTDSGKKLADSVKEDRSNKKYYKEYKFNGHKAYVYSDYDDQLYLIIELKEDKNGTLYQLFVSLERDDNDEDVIVYNVFTQEALQDFFNSIEFEDNVKE